MRKTLLLLALAAGCSNPPPTEPIPCEEELRAWQEARADAEAVRWALITYNGCLDNLGVKT